MAMLVIARGYIWNRFLLHGRYEFSRSVTSPKNAGAAGSSTPKSRQVCEVPGG